MAHAATTSQPRSIFGHSLMHPRTALAPQCRGSGLVTCDPSEEVALISGGPHGSNIQWGNMREHTHTETPKPPGASDLQQPPGEIASKSPHSSHAQLGVLHLIQTQLTRRHMRPPYPLHPSLPQLGVPGHGRCLASRPGEPSTGEERIKTNQNIAEL